MWLIDKVSSAVLRVQSNVVIKKCEVPHHLCAECYPGKRRRGCAPVSVLNARRTVMTTLANTALLLKLVFKQYKLFY